MTSTISFIRTFTRTFKNDARRFTSNGMLPKINLKPLERFNGSESLNILFSPDTMFDNSSIQSSVTSCYLSKYVHNNLDLKALADLAISGDPYNT